MRTGVRQEHDNTEEGRRKQFEPEPCRIRLARLGVADVSGQQERAGNWLPCPVPRELLVEAPGVEPGSEDLQRNGSTCVADRFSFAATHAHRLA